LLALACVITTLTSCGHHTGTDAGACDPTDPRCGTPGNPLIIPCPGCIAFPPPGGNGPPTCTAQGAAPHLAYPPDHGLLPPNMNVVEVQFLPGNGNAVFEIDFANSATDVRFETMCAAITNTRGGKSGGCAFRLDPTYWACVATHNRGGDPVTV